MIFKKGDKVMINGKGPFVVDGTTIYNDSQLLSIEGTHEIIDTARDLVILVTIFTQLADLIGILVEKIKGWFNG